MYLLFFLILIFSGNFTEALYHYEKAYQNENQDLIEWKSFLREEDYEKHIELCKMGVARCSIRVGDFKRGVSIDLFLCKTFEINLLVDNIFY